MIAIGSMTWEVNEKIRIKSCLNIFITVNLLFSTLSPSFFLTELVIIFIFFIQDHILCMCMRWRGCFMWFVYHGKHENIVNILSSNNISRMINENFHVPTGCYINTNELFYIQYATIWKYFFIISECRAEFSIYNY